MATVRLNPNTGCLFLDFRYNGKRYREYTKLPDTTANKRRLQRLGEKIEAEIVLGNFQYHKHFPNSAAGKRFAAKALKKEPRPNQKIQQNTIKPKLSPTVVQPINTEIPSTPLFKDFVMQWLAENKIGWRNSHTTNIKSMINKHYLPYFGSKEVGSITRADLLRFRTKLAKVPGRTPNKGLTANRINKIMDPLRRIFEDAADHYEFNTPFVRIKPLRIQKSDVHPFTLAEVLRIIENVRVDYKNYYIVRFFTGMRTGEIDGLKWQYVDFERREILIRETIVAGKVDITKTDASRREIQMSDAVYQALKRQYDATALLSEFVFCNLRGRPLEHNNVTKRVWYPLLAKLNLEKRRPYQSRHTAATLWLAAGETPEWIARQMGHATTEMLFKVYSRYVPNVTRRDGSAFERLLSNEMNELGAEI